MLIKLLNSLPFVSYHVASCDVQVLGPIRSRCLAIRVAAPSSDEVPSSMAFVSHAHFSTGAFYFLFYFRTVGCSRCHMRCDFQGWLVGNRDRDRAWLVRKRGST